MDELIDRRLDPDYANVTEARRATARALGAAGCRWAEAELAASELVANAIEHAESTIQLRLCRTDDLVRLEVEDDGAGWPEPLHPGPDEINGRGLLIVEELSLRWGVEPSPTHGKTIWAEFHCRPREQPVPAATR
jgi:anti-sigma regulatory factor (Ser/Thr protein kinase)